MHADWLRMMVNKHIPPLDAVPRGIGRSDIVRVLDELAHWREVVAEFMADYTPSHEDVGTPRWSMYELVCDDASCCAWCELHGVQCSTCEGSDRDEHDDNRRRAESEDDR